MQAVKKVVKRIVIAIVALAILSIGAWVGLPYLLTPSYDTGEIPEYDGGATVDINKGKPSFEDNEIKDSFFEKYSDLDRLDRCGAATACLDKEHMPEGERGSIGMIKPSGWQIEKYDFIDNGGYLYNRCHLIGWQLTGQNEEEKNLITGTRYMNTEGMLPYESQVASYIRQTGNHVMYRVTPVFHEKELIARGVQMEAYSVEDHGRGLSFNVYCYNVQPDVVIDYKTGHSKLAEGAKGNKITGEVDNQSRMSSSDQGEVTEKEAYEAPADVTFVFNTNTHKFHMPNCSGVQDIREHNRQEFKGTREEAIKEGYEPCGICKP